MNPPCPHCGGTGRAPDAAERLAEEIRAQLRAGGETVGFDDAVSESIAARVLGVALGTLRNQRTMGKAPPHRRRAHGVIRYPVIELARALLESDF